MGNFVIYDNDGLIHRTGSCPDGMEALQVDENASNFLIGNGNSGTQYIFNGVLVDYTPEELQLKNNLPLDHIWKMPERVVLDMRDLETAKTQAWARIKASRALAEKGTFECDGDVFDCDIPRISNAVQMAVIAKMSGQPFSIDWTLSNNSVKTLTGQQMISVGVALGVRVQLIFETARELRLSIDEATTPSETDQVMWTLV